MTVLLLFFCSGATALIYEVLWSKYLTLLFGSTVQAQTIVLAVFMGGLALGNRIFGSRADRWDHPLRVYGYLEILIGLYGFFFTTIYRTADSTFVSLGSHLIDRSGWLLALKAALSVALVLGPTILMGGTLPVLAAWLQKNSADPGRRSAIFYSINSLGAVCGAWLAGFFLVTWVGMSMSVQLTALVNVLIGFVAVAIAKAQGARGSSVRANAPLARTDATSQKRPAVLLSACLFVSLTGAVSMGLEVLSSRCLCLIFGASLQAFAIVLIAFILGIGLGSAIVASPRQNGRATEITAVALVLGAAVWLGLVVLNVENLFELYRHAQVGLARNLTGYFYHHMLAATFSIVMLGLPAAALGAVLPLWIRIVSESSNLLGAHVGRLLTWNTVGAVVGSLLTGFVLMPHIGLRGSFTTLALVLCAAALFVTIIRRYKIGIAFASLTTISLVVLAASGGSTWRLMLTSGVFRWHETELLKGSIREIRQHQNLVFYRDASDATVSVEESGPLDKRDLALRINGKTDATSHGDVSAQLLLAHLPMMVKPGSQEVFVFGMGSGITAGAVLGYPIERLTVAENCAPVIEAARLFSRWNRGVLTNARTEIRFEDARTVLKLSSRKYDVIIAEPSNPWTAGIGSVFSKDFYEIAAHRLKPGGIMAQWFHVYEINDGIVDMVIRTFGTVFPSIEIWEVNPGDIVILGSDRPWNSNPEAYRSAYALPQPREDLISIGFDTPEMIWARQLASQRSAFALPGPGPIQTDEFPLLEYQAPLAMFVNHNAKRMFGFDERTWQAGIAAPSKRMVLSQLGTNELKRIFSEYGSANEDLQQWLILRCSGRLSDTNAPGNADRLMPCVFRGNNIALYDPWIRPTTNEVAQRLFKAERALILHSGYEVAALQQIEDTLQQTRDYTPEKAGWSAGYYADVGIKVSLERGNVPQAQRILRRGLELEPDSEVLQYLSRIIDCLDPQQRRLAADLTVR